MSGEPCTICGAKLSGSQRKSDLCEACQAKKERYNTEAAERDIESRIAREEA